MVSVGPPFPPSVAVNRELLLLTFSLFLIVILLSTRAFPQVVASTASTLDIWSAGGAITAGPVHGFGFVKPF